MTKPITGFILFILIFNVYCLETLGDEYQIEKREFSMSQEQVEKIYEKCGPDVSCMEKECKEIYLDDTFFNIRCYATIREYQKEKSPETYKYKSQVLSISKPNHYARGIVIQSIAPNQLKVGGREFLTMNNPKGDGVFVYDPRTNFDGVERKLIWIVLIDKAYPLNGASKKITPSLIWPRDADPEIWEKTGLSPYSATEAIQIIFGN